MYVCVLPSVYVCDHPCMLCVYVFLYMSIYICHVVRKEVLSQVPIPSVSVTQLSSNFKLIGVFAWSLSVGHSSYHSRLLADSFSSKLTNKCTKSESSPYFNMPFCFAGNHKPWCGELLPWSQQAVGHCFAPWGVSLSIPVYWSQDNACCSWWGGSSIILSC